MAVTESTAAFQRLHDIFSSKCQKKVWHMHLQIREKPSSYGGGGVLELTFGGVNNLVQRILMPLSCSTNLDIHTCMHTTTSFML